MSRTLNGNLIGKPAQIDKQDQRNQQEHEYWLQHEARMKALLYQSQEAYQHLIELDPIGGEVWFDNDDNVPELGSIKNRIELIQFRIDLLIALRNLMDKIDADQFLATYPSNEQLRTKIMTVKAAMGERDKNKESRIHTSELHISLNDMTNEQLQDWWKSVEEVEVP